MQRKKQIINQRKAAVTQICRKGIDSQNNSKGSKNDFKQNQKE